MSNQRQPPMGPPGPPPPPGSAPPHLPPSSGGYDGGQLQGPGNKSGMVELSGNDLEVDNAALNAGPTEAAPPIGQADTLSYPPGATGPAQAAQPAGQPFQGGGAPAPPAPYNPGGAPPAGDPNANPNFSGQGAGPQLLIIGGNNRGREYPLHFGDNSIGRGVDNDVILADIAVSRKHTIVCWENGQFMVRDLGSGNGTLYNGKRVDNHQLRDGDQLELGNTLLRFVCPPSLMSPEVAEAETVVTGRDQPQQPMMAPPPQSQPYGHQTEMAVAQKNPQIVRPAKAGMSRTAKLAIFGGIALVVLFGLMIGGKLLLNRSKAGGSTGQQVRSPDEVAAEEFQKGTTHFQAREWDKAQVSFLKVLKLAPSFEQAKRYADRSAKEIKAKKALDKAKESLGKKDFKAVRDQLTKIPSGSVYAADGRKLKGKTDDAQVTALLAEARKLKKGEDNDSALAKVKEAKKILPDNQAVKDLYAELSGTATGTDTSPVATRTPKRNPGRTSPGRRNPGRRNPGRTTPRRHASRVKRVKVGRGKARAAIKLYKQRQWAQAFNTIKDHAGSQSGARKKQAEKLADAIRVVARNWIRGERATKPASAIKYYQTALSADRKLGGPHQRELKKRIYEQARRHATNSLAKKRYSSAYSAYKLAKNYGSVDPVLRRVMQALERKAEDYFTKGYTKRSTNIASARKLWKQVLHMVPHTNAHYQKAYKYLNSSAPSYQDEDED